MWKGGWWSYDMICAEMLSIVRGELKVKSESDKWV